MNHAPLEAVSDLQLPSAQSQGFAHVMVVPFSDPYSTGPLTASPELATPNRVAVPHGIRRGPLAGRSDPVVG